MNRCNYWKECKHSCWNENDEVPNGAVPWICLDCVKGDHMEIKATIQTNPV